jgi:hypothetical protein
MRRAKQKSLGFGGTGAGFLWGVYSAITTAKDIPQDAGWLAKMLADPPVYLPWLMAAIGIVILIWAFVWPSKPSEPESPDITQSPISHGPNSPAIGTNYGPIHIAPPPPAATQPQKSPYRYNLAALGKGLERVNAQLERQSNPMGLARYVIGPPKRDVSLAEALAYAEFKEWGRSFFDAASSANNGADEQLKKFHQLAYDGQLSVWGQREYSDLYQPIDPDHWSTHRIEWFELLRGKPKTEPMAKQQRDPYFNIMVSRAEFEREWPNG